MATDGDGVTRARDSVSVSDPSATRSNGQRPWLCPEGRCQPLLNLRDGEYADITVQEAGHSFTCWGRMTEPVTFIYDGVEHTNDHNCCHYTPLKGLIRWQENPDDWAAMASYYRLAYRKAIGEI